MGVYRRMMAEPRKRTACMRIGRKLKVKYRRSRTEDATTKETALRRKGKWGVDA
jgi:hypothetical protein